MNVAQVDYPRPLMAQGQRGPFNRGPIFRNLELSIERAPQGARRCRRCAAVNGRYVCTPSAAVRNEWRHSDSGLEMIVHLLTCRPDSGPRLQAMIRVEKESELHARAVYSCEPLSVELQDGPWTLNLISETSDCDFVFPAQVEVVSSDTLPTPHPTRQTSSN